MNYTEAHIPVENLLLDPNNYRFQESDDFVYADESRFAEQQVQARDKSPSIWINWTGEQTNDDETGIHPFRRGAAIYSAKAICDSLHDIACNISRELEPWEHERIGGLAIALKQTLGPLADKVGDYKLGAETPAAAVTPDGVRARVEALGFRYYPLAGGGCIVAEGPSEHTGGRDELLFVHESDDSGLYEWLAGVEQRAQRDRLPAVGADVAKATDDDEPDAARPAPTETFGERAVRELDRVKRVLVGDSRYRDPY